MEPFLSNSTSLLGYVYGLLIYVCTYLKNRTYCDLFKLTLSALNFFVRRVALAMGPGSNVGICNSVFFTTIEPFFSVRGVSPSAADLRDSDNNSRIRSVQRRQQRHPQPDEPEHTVLRDEDRSGADLG